MKQSSVFYDSFIKHTGLPARSYTLILFEVQTDADHFKSLRDALSKTLESNLPATAITFTAKRVATWDPKNVGVEAGTLAIEGQFADDAVKKLNAALYDEFSKLKDDSSQIVDKYTPSNFAPMVLIATHEQLKAAGMNLGTEISSKRKKDILDEIQIRIEASTKTFELTH